MLKNDNKIHNLNLKNKTDDLNLFNDKLLVKKNSTKYPLTNIRQHCFVSL